ncbi:MAG: acyl-CoA thioesterase [Flavobacteriales bacterium]|nr:acyl-CoA thioesterase [Flavobacteriales bacterium]|tara:strand:+ start:99 stop:608 length:510 start_codon:yes stop_codon:yes gene_type:complete
MSTKTPSQSQATLTEIVLPNDTNNLNNLMGGRLLHWMDIAAAITAHRHCNRTCVTASVNNVSFEHPIPKGSIVTLEANISRAFSSSMEIFIDVWIEDNLSGSKTKCNEAIYTFVAVDNMGKPTKVPAVNPETELEKKRYDGALRRRQLSLILAGKLKADEASELKALFN